MDEPINFGADKGSEWERFLAQLSPEDKSGG
jgi:hypothetical protein